MKPGPPYRAIVDFLPSPIPEQLFGWAKANHARFKPTVLGAGQHDPRIRLSVGVRSFGPQQAELEQRVLNIVPDLMKVFGISKPAVGSLEMQLVAHNHGAHYDRHIDTMSGANWAKFGVRTLSMVYYFHRRPKAFSGGCLRLHPFGVRDQPDGHVDIEPDHNVLLAFPAWVEHEVLPVGCPSRQFADSRFAVNIWVHAPIPTVESA